MTALDKAFRAVRRTPARVVFPEWDDRRVAKARERLIAEGLCQPVPVADADAAMESALARNRSMKPAIARRMLARPLIRAAAMVATGAADTMVAGADVPTRRVIEAASLAIGRAPGVSAPSSFFLMLFPGGREMIFADCAATVSPDAATLAAIAHASAASASALLGRAEVALLSYATGASGSGASVDLVAEVARATGYSGPIQADAALNATIAARKGVPGGTANTLVFPDLNAGNIGYKLCQELAGAQAIGPFLQGFRKPVCDLSRGASVDDVVAATVLTLALAQT